TAYSRPDPTMIHYERRYSRWYELLLMSRCLQVVAGLLCVLLVPPWWGWGRRAFVNFPVMHGPVQYNSMLAVGAAFLLACYLLARIGRYGTGIVWAHIGSVVSATFLLAFAVILFLRLEYSRSILLIGYGLAMLWC